MFSIRMHVMKTDEIQRRVEMVKFIGIIYLEKYYFKFYFKEACQRVENLAPAVPNDLLQFLI